MPGMPNLLLGVPDTQAAAGFPVLGDTNIKAKHKSALTAANSYTQAAQQFWYTQVGSDHQQLLVWHSFQPQPAAGSAHLLCCAAKVQQGDAMGCSHVSAVHSAVCPPACATLHAPCAQLLSRLVPLEHEPLPSGQLGGWRPLIRCPALVPLHAVDGAVQVEVEAHQLLGAEHTGGSAAKAAVCQGAPHSDVCACLTAHPGDYAMGWHVVLLSPLQPGPQQAPLCRCQGRRG